MSNIINVREERNVLSFDGEVFNIVANSSNFYLKFELDNEWELNSIITVIFNFDGKNEYVELDENRMCQIPPTDSSKIWFCITTEPDEVSKLSSTILSLDVEPSGETDTDGVEFYKNTHKNLLGVVQNLLDGEISAKTADFAEVAGKSQTQVSLTGDEDIAGVKNFTGTIKQNANLVYDTSMLGKPNYVMNGNFRINTRGKTTYTRSGTDIFTADRWCLSNGNGKFKVSAHQLTVTDETEPVVFYQFIEDSKDFLGNMISVGATINGVRWTTTLEFPSTIDADMIINLYEGDDYAIRFYVKKLTKMSYLEFIVNPGVVLILDEIKVEISEYPTKYIETSRAEETSKCQRYFQKLNVYTVGHAVSEQKLTFFVPVATTLRAIGTVKFLAKPSYILNGTEIDMTEATAYLINANGLLIDYMGSGFTPGNSYLVSGGTMEIDAEVYL